MALEHHIHRCTSCNRVNHQEIETEVGDFYKGTFMPDPVDKKNYICLDCKEWHEELMMDYELKDDPYGWWDAFAEPLALSLETEIANDNETEEDSEDVTPRN